MTEHWRPEPTNTHQDHVTAHVIGTTVLGSFQADDATHLLLDIGFVWTIYVDGEMELIPQKVAISDLSTDEKEKNALRGEIDVLLEGRDGTQDSTAIVPAPVDCLIKDVEFYASSDNRQRKVLLRGEEASLSIKTSLATGEMLVETVGNIE